jgi:type IV pilus assembly protein PilE
MKLRNLHTKTITGFTLIELMIVTAIVAILTAIAIPNYSEYVQRSDRKAAIAVMLEAQQFAERVFTERRSYVGVNTQLPAALTRAPRDAPTPKYAIAITGVTANTYSVVATPSTTLSRCGTISVNQLGNRQVSVPASPTAADIADCFKR